MSNITNKFFRLAVRETDLPDRAFGVADEAAAKVFGAIWQVANTRDQFIRAGLSYVEDFEESAEQSIEDLMQNEVVDEEVVQEIRSLIEEAKDVSFSGLFDLLAADWDERHDEAD